MKMIACISRDAVQKLYGLKHSVDNLLNNPKELERRMCNNPDFAICYQNDKRLRFLLH